MDASAKLTMLTRIGFAARGLLYLTIAVLLIGTGRAESPSGALRYLGEGAGRWLLVVVAAGLVAYGLWRLADAVFDIERHGANPKDQAKRLGAGASGVVHLFLAWQAIRLIRGTGSSGGSGPAEQGAQTALTLPGGALMLVLAGAVLLGVGAYQLFKAVKGDFLRHLEPRIAHQPWAEWSGKLGYAARGIVFLISGGFLLGAGLQEQASQAGGMAQALSWLRSPWDLLVAVGLFGFGLFSLIEARYRMLHDVPVDGAVRRAASKSPV